MSGRGLFRPWEEVFALSYKRLAPENNYPSGAANVERSRAGSCVSSQRGDDGSGNRQ